MPMVQVPISIPKEELVRWYSGEAKDVSARSLDGRSVRFPAKLLHPFVSHHGITGVFEIEFTQEGQFSGIRRLG